MDQQETQTQRPAVTDWRLHLSPQILVQAASREVVVFLHGAAVHLGPDGQDGGLLLRVVPDWDTILADAGASPAWRSPR